MEQPKEYYAFISYKREDEKWAKWLQKKLEHYHLPTKVRRDNPSLPQCIRPVFKDTSELAAGVLADEIHEALENSRYLIVICSPMAAQSKWVGKEVQYFVDKGRTDRIIPFVIGGKPFSVIPEEECFPSALLNLPKEQELLGVNINEMGRDAAVVKVVARMFGLKFDTLWQRYERDQKKRRWMMTGVLVFFGIISMLVASYIAKKNIELEEQHALVLKSNCMQSVSLMKSFIYQNKPELALSIIRNVERDKDILDSASITEYQRLFQALCDSILTSNALLVDINKCEKMVKPQPAGRPEGNKVLQIKESVNERNPFEVMLIHNSKSNTTDSIVAEPRLNYEKNRNSDHIAVYVEGSMKSTGEMDIVYSPDKTGIRIYSLISGEMIHFVACWGDYVRGCPMGVSNNGEMLIFREGHRGAERIWLMDFKTKERFLLLGKSYYSGEKINVSFSPDDNFFSVFYKQRNTIDIYSTKTRKVIRSFYYEGCEEVFWSEPSNINIISNRLVYVWKIKEQTINRILSIDSQIKGVALSNSNETVAAICDNGKAYVWDVKSGKCLFAEDFLGSPEDVAISNDNKYLWAISSYYLIKIIDLKHKTYIYSGGTYDGTRPCETYLYMTKDGNYCISCLYDAGHQYDIFDMKGNHIYGVERGHSIGSNVSDSIISEFVYPKKEDTDVDANEGPVKMLGRVSSNGELCVEGYSDGTFKLYSVKEKEGLITVINSMIQMSEEQ